MDAPEKGIRRVLCQQEVDMNWPPIAFFLHKMLPDEWNY